MKTAAHILLTVISIIFCISFFTAAWATTGPAWYEAYNNGLSAMQRSDWNAAVTSFQQAIQIQSRDNGKMRVHGTVFIEYYPHRELGICYFYLGDMEKARQELTLSIQQSSTRRAQMYLDAVNKGQAPPRYNSHSCQPDSSRNTGTFYYSHYHPCRIGNGWRSSEHRRPSF